MRENDFAHSDSHEAEPTSVISAHTALDDHSASGDETDTYEGSYIGLPDHYGFGPVTPEVATLHPRLEKSIGQILDSVLRLLQQVYATDPREDFQTALKEFSDIARPILVTYFHRSEDQFKEYMDSARPWMRDSFDAQDFVVLDSLGELATMKKTIDGLMKWLIIRGGTDPQKPRSARSLAARAGISNKTASGWIEASRKAGGRPHQLRTSIE